jgi:hypothetical protein
VLEELNIDLRFPRSSERGSLETKKGLLMVVTRIACFSSALSGTLMGRKLIKPSNGRWDGSTAGSESRALLRSLAERDRGRPGRSKGSRIEVEAEALGSEGRWIEEDCAEAGVLYELLKRRMDGGVRWSRPSSSTASSTAP